MTQRWLGQVKDITLGVVKVLGVVFLNVCVLYFFLVGLLNTDPIQMVSSWWMRRAFPAQERARYGTLCQSSASVPDSSISETDLRYVVVNCQTGDIHNAFAGVPKDHRAKGPNDANALVCVCQSMVRVGTYTDGSVAQTINYAVALIDLKTGQVLARETFAGGEPPARKSSGGARTGSPPDDELQRWLGQVAEH